MAEARVMRAGLRCAAMVLLLVTGVAARAALPPPEKVSFPSLDTGVTVTGLLFHPPAATQPVPVIVGLHGCGGMWSSAQGRRDQLEARSTAWTERFLAQGYAVLWPDSFNPRGKRSVCAIARGEPSIDPSTRRLDVLGALAFVKTQRALDPARIAIVGWSHGGSTVLASVNGRDAEVARAFAAGPAPRAAIAFYPGCGVATRMRDAWLPAVPLALFSGALDDWSATPVCERLADAVRKLGGDMTITVYPDAHHGFDGPGDKVVHRADVTRGVNAGSGVTAGPNPAARAAVEIAVPAWLRDHFKGTSP